MNFSLPDLLTPHYCCSCGKIGSVLCDYCKYNIINDVPVYCAACSRLVSRPGDVCSSCSVAYTKAWLVSEYRGVIKQLVVNYKFDGLRAASKALASLLNEVLPNIPNDVIITSVPTARGHIRQRGYDHAALIAKHLAQCKRLTYQTTLVRNHSKAQRGANRKQRIKQAQTAFTAKGSLNGKYLLVDDVLTTGATVNYAAKALKAAGADEVWVAVVAREPLD